MKNIIYAIALLCWANSLSAQKNITLKINHFLGNTAFAFNQTATNNLGNDFQVTRLQYYISEITLYHDNTTTEITGKHILVNANTMVNEALGSYNVVNLDSISFGIGVDTAYNHLDPALNPIGHPLGPQSPSMHWGWTAGYRFIAYEGVSGVSMTDAVEIHAIGDVNYVVAKVVTNGYASSSTDLDIVLNADYANGLNNLDVSSGLIYHGQGGATKGITANFRSEVFSDASNSVSVNKLEDEATVVNVYPNPVQINTPVQLELEEATDRLINVYDVLGKKVQSISTNEAQPSLSFEHAGWYFVQIVEGNKVIQSQKVQVYE
jgi:hypothetical protein